MWKIRCVSGLSFIYPTAAACRDVQWPQKLPEASDEAEDLCVSLSDA